MVWGDRWIGAVYQYKGFNLVDKQMFALLNDKMFPVEILLKLIVNKVLLIMNKYAVFCSLQGALRISKTLTYIFY